MSALKQTWRPVPGYEDAYEVSSLGRVRSLDRVVSDSRGRLLQRKGKLLRPGISGTGYRTVVLCSPGHRGTVKVAVLVTKAFHGPKPSPKHMVCHWDGTRTNDSADNLRWGTMRENTADSRRHGVLAVGERQGSAKLTAAQVIALRSDPRPQHMIARELGVHPSTISKTKSGQRWAHLQEAA